MLTPPTAISFFEALRFWFRLGFISFGGPTAQIALMHTEIVVRRRWISERRFMHALNYCMVLPGPEAQQLATYLGWLMHRTWGGVMAGVLFVLPSLFILIALAWIYLQFGHTLLVAGVFYGMKPAVTALVLHAAYRMGSRVLNNRWMWGIAIGALTAMTVFNIPFPLVIVAAALVGYAGSRYAPQNFTQGSHHATSQSGIGSALIDDETPLPAHAHFSRGYLFKVLLVGLGLWVAGMVGLVAAFGFHGTLTHMAWFFTKAALLTFGGAYAVLPYVYQGAVEHYGWLSAAQMMDGLALGETTPGPLIMVVAFVGFVGGWLKEILGADALFMGGVLAASIVTFFTFLPSFIFILVGAPMIESTRGQLGLSAPLSAITAAVVGVIIHLAVFFAQSVLWPQGAQSEQGSFDPASLAIMLLAALALFRFKVGVMTLLVCAALLGLAIQFFRP